MPGFTETQKREIFERDKWTCQFCGRGKADGVDLIIHHIERRGMGSKPSANRVENGITLCLDCHHKLHPDKGIAWEIVKWNPSDKENGLEVVDSEGRRVPHEKLYFYRRHLAEEAEARRRLVAEWAQAMRWNTWKAAEAIEWLKAHMAHEWLGYGSLYEMLAEEGIKSSQAKKLIRVWRLAKERGVLDKVTELDPDVADRVLRKVPDEELQDWLTKAKTLGPADFEKEWRQRFGRKKLKTYLVLDKADGARLIEAEDEEQVPGEVVVRVGAVVRGREKVEGNGKS